MKESKKESPSKKQLKKQNKILKNTLLTIAIVIFAVFIMYFYFQSQTKFDYKGVEFELENVGTNEAPLLMYKTNTLLPSNDETGALFGFRVRTKPSKLKNVDFEGLEDFQLFKLNGYSYQENMSFNCQGYGVIAMENLRRVFNKTGMQFLLDPNATCDDQGRYNYFNIKYGDKTEIKKIGISCYDIIIKGDDNECEILKATEKLMVEIFVKYGVVLGELN